MRRFAVVVVVFNNFRLGSQRKRVEAYGPVIGVDHGNPDFAKLAKLFGCKGYRVDQPGQFQTALQDAMATGEPCIIDVIIDPEADVYPMVPPGMSYQHMVTGDFIPNRYDNREAAAPDASEMF